MLSIPHHFFGNFSLFFWFKNPGLLLTDAHAPPKTPIYNKNASQRKKDKLDRQQPSALAGVATKSDNPLLACCHAATGPLGSCLDPAIESASYAINAGANAVTLRLPRNSGERQTMPNMPCMKKQNQISTLENIVIFICSPARLGIRCCSRHRGPLGAAAAAAASQSCATRAGCALPAPGGPRSGYSCYSGTATGHLGCAIFARACPGST